jgi:hypothetical protein
MVTTHRKLPIPLAVPLPEVPVGGPARGSPATVAGMTPTTNSASRLGASPISPILHADNAEANAAATTTGGTPWT